jgi:hypothetical protein
VPGLEVVEGFRTALSGGATRRADAWVELGDALVVTERLVSLPPLSLGPLHRRGHGSRYAGLRHGEVATERLRGGWLRTYRVGHRWLRWTRR